ncbi:Hsp20/alpha crystallin family protein [Streptomyces sp. NPDC050743]|uniref:Hsp20/alpha crystallin family protein n=1 Tax=Streptomyces sp. NPDC050743 TaxID=3365634 RepID=UPI00378FB374
MELHGVKSKDVDVEANPTDRSGGHRRERKGALRRGSRRTGTFEHRLRLFGEVDAEKITADMSAGVLTVTVPKAEVTKPRRIRITESNESGGH